MKKAGEVMKNLERVTALIAIFLKVLNSERERERERERNGKLNLNILKLQVL